MRHSKFRNTGILFELLTRQVTADIIAGRDTSTAKDLLYKYFKENTELGKEWQFYNTLINEKMHSLMNQTTKQLNKINQSRKREQAYNPAYSADAIYFDKKK
jgi:hypothetical protein